MSFLNPKAGDLVLFCMHADVSEEHIDISKEACTDQPFHWYFLAGPDDGPNMSRQTSRGKKDHIVINWLAHCNRCYLESPDPPARMMGQEARWIGPPPEIRND